MSLTILSDEVITQLLESLTCEQAEDLAHTLSCALHEYSTGTQSLEAGLIHQPERTVVQSATTGATTLFMPTLAPAGHGVKVVTLSTPGADPSLPSIKPTGSVTLYSPLGTPVGFLHAQTLTAFRTALASSCLLQKRNRVQTITVFGTGLQAYWHIRLSLLLRGSTIRNVNVINRRFSDNARDILGKFYAIPQEVKQREGWEDTKFSILTPNYTEYNRLQKEQIRAADVLYCCTPSTEDLFDPTILTNIEGRRKGRLIVAIGSYQPHMRELPRELLMQATKQHHHGHVHFHRHAVEGGVVVVDTLDGALKEAGEIMEAGLQPKQLVELGELVMIHKAREEEEHQPHASGSSVDTGSGSGSASRSGSIADSFDLKSVGSAMSTVFGSSSSQPNRSNTDNSRATSRSPEREGGKRRGSILSAVPLPFGKKSHSRRSSSSHRRSSEQDRRSSTQTETQAQDNQPGQQNSHAENQGLPDREVDQSPTATGHHLGKSSKERHDDHLARWLSSGNVIYKSVGLGLMDLTVGMEVVRLAREKGLGAHIENFTASAAPSTPASS
ncbi:ornithine cyclodeaminase [Xylariomycetidae sp. FL0641]|nr:ornithine cyclodeaminase [Xylariomycetidae sp. FL0641]